MLTPLFSSLLVSYALLEQLELLYETGQAVDHGHFPQPLSLNWYQYWFGLQKSSLSESVTYRSL
jgi:hypothetical protein